MDIISLPLDKYLGVVLFLKIPLVHPGESANKINPSINHFTKW